MNTCGTCKHWGAGRNEHEYAGASVSRDDEFKPCGAIIQEDYYDEKKIAGKRAFVQDGSGYYAAIKVREDFGCVLWTAK